MNAQDPYFSANDPAIERADDVELLLRIFCREETPEDAEEAFVIFFYRHAEFLRLSCERFGFCHPSVPAEAVTNLTMAKVLSGEIEDFKVPEGVEDPDIIMRLIRAWLIKVAQFTFYDERKKVCSKAEVINYDPSADDRPEPTVTPQAYMDDEQPQPTAPERTAILALRDELSPEDRLLLDRSVEYYDPVSGDCKVPSAVAQGLARELGVTPPTARKRRERLFARLKSKLEAISTTTSQ